MHHTNCGSLPEVETLAANIKDATHVTVHGNIVDEGSTAVTSRGFCWALNSNPSVNDNFSQDAFGPGKFNSELQVVPDTTYYIKAYAVNQMGTSYGNEGERVDLAGWWNRRNYASLPDPEISFVVNRNIFCIFR